MSKARRRLRRQLTSAWGKLAEGTECTESKDENLFDCMGAADIMQVVLWKNIGDIKKALDVDSFISFDFNKHMTWFFI